MAHDPLLIDVFELARRGESVHGRLGVEDLPRLAESLAAAEGTVSYEFSGAVDREGRPAATLQLAGELPLRCDRCGNLFQWRLEVRAPYFFVRTEAELVRLPIDEAEDEPLLGSTQFDLRSLIEDEAILALPLAPRHADCSTPRPVLPDGQAEGQTENGREQSPFAVLADLKPRRH